MKILSGVIFVLSTAVFAQTAWIPVKTMKNGMQVSINMDENQYVDNKKIWVKFKEAPKYIVKNNHTVKIEGDRTLSLFFINCSNKTSQAKKYVFYVNGKYNGEINEYDPPSDIIPGSLEESIYKIACRE